MPTAVFPGKVKGNLFFQCPNKNCRYLITYKEIWYKSANYSCPRCGEHNFSEFESRLVTLRDPKESENPLGYQLRVLADLLEIELFSKEEKDIYLKLCWEKMRKVAEEINKLIMENNESEGEV